MNYHDLYQDDDMGEKYPADDDKVGKPKKKDKGIKNKIDKGGTKAKKTATTTTGPDDRMNPSDANKAHPGYDKPTP